MNSPLPIPHFQNECWKSAGVVEEQPIVETYCFDWIYLKSGWKSTYHVEIQYILRKVEIDFVEPENLESRQHC